jgi:thioredoxin 1
MLHLTDHDFATETEGRVAIIDLWAPWCGPCLAFAPVFEAVAAELGDDVLFAKVNVDENPAIAQRFGVQSIPTLLVLGTDGDVLRRAVGAMSRPQFERVVGDALSSAA